MHQMVTIIIIILYGLLTALSFSLGFGLVGWLIVNAATSITYLVLYNSTSVIDKDKNNR